MNTHSATRMKAFVKVHENCTSRLYKDLSRPQHGRDPSLGSAFLNIYKIHIELTDSLIVLLSNPYVSHIPSGIILRSMFENFAMFSYLCASEDKVIQKYVSKIEYFKGKTPEDILSKLSSSDNNNFANISRLSEKTIDDRISMLGKDIHMIYAMLSSYVHVSPYITKQLQFSPERVANVRKDHLSAMCVLYSRLLSLATSNHLIDDTFTPLQEDFLNLVEFATYNTKDQKLD